ncbi:hypothetical protein PPYR_15309 [Photinus pyralis]|uniref:Oligopeptide transporter 1 n=1 Tax=Photinus pyralis TaxID=7054 RepID=A0A5N4A0I5_PHOPY|nr:hypothetical protein PPYR_15309 [Photinus pyralis]
MAPDTTNQDPRHRKDDGDSSSESSFSSNHSVTPLKKLPYPKSVFFIVSNEFCERFSFYGMRTILSLYLVDILLYSESDATVIFHVFTMMVYFFPVFGAIISDSWLGKFRTILYVSCIYALGNIVLALAATPPLNFPMRPISLVGLLLIAIGTGGIKPCVSAFGGDQFTLPQQAAQLATFFSLFYFSINAGSLLSTFITPILREDVKCFGKDSCYSLAFGIPGVLMVISIIIFGVGRPLYKVKKPEGNMMVQVSKCIGNAISTKLKTKGVSKASWLDYAEEAYGSKLVTDVKRLMKVLVLFIPLPVFWALFDQQGSGWTFMARRMNGDIAGFTILPDQMQVINPLLILAFIPLFQYVIYPILNKCKILTTPLQRLVAGGCLAGISFIISAVICLFLESTFPILPHATNGQLRIYNALPCDITIAAKELAEGNIVIPPGNNYTNIDIEVLQRRTFAYTASGCGSTEGKFIVTEKRSTAYLFNQTEHPAYELEDNVDKNKNGNPKLRLLLGAPNPVEIKIVNSDGVEQMRIDSSNSSMFGLRPDNYTFKFGDKYTYTADLKLGGVYAMVGHQSDNEFKISLHTVTSPNSLSIFLLLPQYIVMTMGEIMFSITGLEFAYSQSPTSMKSVLQACWLLTTAFGNLIVVIIESAEPFHDQSKTFFLYAGLMFADMIVFSLMAMRYEYVKKEDVDDTQSANDNNNGRRDSEKLKGISNVAFTTTDEKGLNT